MLTIINKGDEIVSLLAVRVVALNSQGVPVREWTEVVATPLAIEGEWRGPLMPGNQRHAILSGYLGRGVDGEEKYTAAIEIADVRVQVAPGELPKT